MYPQQARIFDAQAAASAFGWMVRFKCFVHCASASIASLIHQVHQHLSSLATQQHAIINLKHQSTINTKNEPLNRRKDLVEGSRRQGNNKLLRRSRHLFRPQRRRSVLLIHHDDYPDTETLSSGFALVSSLLHSEGNTVRMTSLVLSPSLLIHR